MLSKQQIEQFNRDGFLLVRALYTPEEMLQISAWTDEVASADETPGKTMMYFESSQQDDSRILSRVENFVPFHDGFQHLITRRLGESSILFKDKINFKLAGADGFKEHQDVQAGWDDYADLHITAMIAIDETNEANGSLEVIAGMHKQGVLGEMWAPLTDSDTANVPYQAIHCQPGDAIFFDSYAPHRSMPNKTDHARRVLYITFNKMSDGDHRAQYYADKRRNYPPDIERDPNKEYAFKV
jgi:ectoine hydroxylase-related dioxygenase (phytanoyl-CoA dioxygenase family)